MEPRSLADVLRNIKEPDRWADHAALRRVLMEVPSVRGMVYGNVAEIEFAEWLVDNGIPAEDHLRDDDHLKTKSDRTILYGGRRYTIQLKSMQTNSIKEPEPRRFTAKIQCDASDKRKVPLPSGREIETTCYVVGEFHVLGVALHPFVGKWDFAFKLNDDLPRSTYHGYTEEEREYLLKTLVDIEFPLTEEGGWTTDLLGLLDGSPDLGDVLDENGHRKVVRPPGEDETIVVKQDE